MLDSSSQKVLDIYSRVNPSDHSNTDIDEVLLRLYNNHLHLPRSFFRDKILLDCGCGSGHPAKVLSQLGAKVYAFDYDLKSLQNLSNQDFSKSSYIPQSVQFSFDQLGVSSPFEIDSFDIINCIGVLHHLSDPYLSLRRILNLAKDSGSIAILGFGEQTPSVQHLLLKYIVRLFKDSFESLEDCVLHLFPEYLERCTNHGRRSLNAVIHDQIINPQHNYLCASKVIRECELQGFSLLTRCPPPSGLFGDSPKSKDNVIMDEEIIKSSDLILSAHSEPDIKINSFNSNFTNSSWECLQSIGSLLSGDSDKVSTAVSPSMLLKNFDGILSDQPVEANTYNNLSSYLEEIQRLLKICQTNSLPELKEFLSETKILFKGSSGINIVYYVFERRACTD